MRIGCSFLSMSMSSARQNVDHDCLAASVGDDVRVLRVKLLHPKALPLCDKSKPWLRFVHGGSVHYRNFQVLGEVRALQRGQVKT